MDTEEWTLIPGWCDRYYINRSGQIFGVYRGKVMSPKVTPEGYVQISFYHRELETKKTLYVHRLVAQAFIPNPELKEEVNHKDGNKLNNNHWNLEWVTPSENCVHAEKYNLRTHKNGNDCHTSKLTEQAVREIFHSNERRVDIAKKYGISLDSVYCIRAGKNWKHLNLGSRYAA